MTSDIRDWMNAQFDRAERDAELQREPQRAVLDLQRLFDSLDAADRCAAEVVVAEWVLSDDRNKRFDALALIDHFELRSALSSLGVLGGRLADATGPEAKYELAKVRRLMTKLREFNGGVGLGG